MNISVIIPVYNAEKYIGKAVESAQQFQDVKEIVIIDDGYEDDAVSLVKEMSTNDSRIKIYAHPNNENRGAGASRNLGIEKATQDYIAFLDADDFFLPNRFHKDKEIFAQHPDADGCHNAIGSYFYTEKAKEDFLEDFHSEITSVRTTAKPNPENLFDGLIGLLNAYGYFSLDGFTIKRDALLQKNLRMIESSMHEDTEFLIRLSYECRLFPSEIEKPVAMRGVHEENRISANNRLSQSKKAYKRYLLWNRILTWSKDKNLSTPQKKHLQQITTEYKLLSSENPRIMQLIVTGLRNPKILRSKRYVELHKHYFGHLSYSHTLFTLKTKFIDPILKAFK